VSLTIRAWPGYDHRDDTTSNLGCAGLTLSFAVTEPGKFSCHLEVMTGWMAHPLATRAMRMGQVQVRRATPGLDEGYHRGLTAAVYLCVPVEAEAPDHFAWPQPGDNDCPHLGVPCKGTVGHLIADEALRVLIENGEDALEEWLRECATDWLTPDA
jgi:hypothetical protein